MDNTIVLVKVFRRQSNLYFVKSSICVSVPIASSDAHLIFMFMVSFIFDCTCRKAMATGCNDLCDSAMEARSEYRK